MKKYVVDKLSSKQQLLHFMERLSLAIFPLWENPNPNATCQNYWAKGILNPHNSNSLQMLKIAANLQCAQTATDKNCISHSLQMPIQNELDMQCM